MERCIILIQSPQNYAAPQNVNPQTATQPKKPVYAPSYNAVQINLDTPTLNAPRAGYYYDYPQAQSQPYYQPIPQQTPAQQPQAPAQQPVNVPDPVVEQAPTQTQGAAPAAPAQPQQPATPTAPVVDTAAVVANLADADFDKQAMQMEEIAQ